MWTLKATPSDKAQGRVSHLLHTQVSWQGRAQVTGVAGAGHDMGSLLLWRMAPPTFQGRWEAVEGRVEVEEEEEVRIILVISVIESFLDCGWTISYHVIN